MDSTRVFKFASLRNSSDVVTTAAELIVQPASPLVTSIIAINDNASLSSAQKLSQLNSTLQTFLNGASFYKTKAAVVASYAQTGRPDYYDKLYDNIVARTITKSTNSPIYKMVVEQLKAEHIALKQAHFPNISKSKVRIVLPDGIIFNFIGSSSTTVGSVTTAVDEVAIVNAYNDALAMFDLVAEAREENVVELRPSGEIVVMNTANSLLNDLMGQDQVSVQQAQEFVQNELMRLQGSDPQSEPVQLAKRQVMMIEQKLTKAKSEGTVSFERTSIINGDKYASLIGLLGGTTRNLPYLEKVVGKKLQDASKQMFQLAPQATYTQIGSQWVNTSTFSSRPESVPGIQGDSIMVYSNGCWLKFPFQIADLRTVDHQTVGYLPAEIAHIQNTQAGEKNVRVTRRLKRVETLDSLISEDEVTRETDNQSTEKFGMEREASQVQTEESSWNINASVSATYGPISASVDGGYESSSSTTNSNSSSASYAKEVVQKVVDRVSHKVRSERTTKTLEEFEETVTHEINNEGEGPKSYVYRWLNKLTRATLKNYGKRLIFQIDVAHPSHFHLSRMLKQMPTLVLPQDPRTLNIGGVTIDHPTKINRGNYMAIGDIYRLKLEAPPAERVVVSKGFAKKGGERETKTITIPKGYGATFGRMKAFSWNQNFVIFVGPSHHAEEWWSGSESLGVWNGAQDIWFNQYGGTPITDGIDVSIWNEVDYMVNFEVECLLLADTYQAWQLKTFQAVTEAYDNMVAEAKAKMGEFDPNDPGLNPAEKLALIRTELKKEVIRKMFRCNPLGIKDKYVVGQEYQSDCCKDSSNAEKVRFLETTFDWRNLTYELYPYFYGSRDVLDGSGKKLSDNWLDILKVTDDDPHFEAFLQASYATVRIPVHRDSMKELAAINFIMNNSIANYEVVPEGAQPLLDELELEPVTMFTYDVDGNELPAPKETIDLGVFPVPTDLVILECGTQNGVKPIGFEMVQGPDDAPLTIPKQYSPAIIADSCNP